MRAAPAIKAVPASGDTTLLTLGVQGLEQVGIELKNEGANALDNLDVIVKFGEDGSEIVIAGAGADFTTPNWPVIKASGDLNSLASGAVGWLVLDVRAFFQVIVKASGATGGTSIKSRATGA